MQTVRASLHLHLTSKSKHTPSTITMYLIQSMPTPNIHRMKQVKAALARFGVAPDNIALLDAVLAYAGASKRAPGKLSFRLYYIFKTDRIAVVSFHSSLPSLTITIPTHGGLAYSSHWQ